MVLTKEGRRLLEGHRDGDGDHQQTFYAGLVRERELEHDVQSYRAYEQAEARLLERGAHVDRVVLDHELKSEYQRWLHERDKDRDDYDGHPDRTAEEIREWADEHDLPYFDDEVHFPDVRIEYQEPDGRWEREDIEVMTEHYRGAHGASVARSGFSCYRGLSNGISGRSGGARGGGRHAARNGVCLERFARRGQPAAVRGLTLTGAGVDDLAQSGGYRENSVNRDFVVGAGRGPRETSHSSARTSASAAGLPRRPGPEVPM